MGQRAYKERKFLTTPVTPDMETQVITVVVIVMPDRIKIK